jgi:hypothetical protein
MPPSGPIFEAVSWFPRPSMPRAAFRDLAAFMRHRSREQVIGACLALLATAIIVVEFTIDPPIGPRPAPQITYVDLYSSNRTDAEIVADQKKDQENRDAGAKERQRQFQKLQKRFGIE